jgi:predicted RNA-binding Zn-ribbon protein involved in translation (DUF1610 family)
VAQPLGYPLRLPDEAQAAALRLLGVAQQVINTALVALWPRLDEFGVPTASPAYKQVEAMMGSPQPHGSRQWRCEAGMVGRILRAQAERKQLFQQVLPLLSEGLIQPKTGKHKAGKNRKAIRAALVGLRSTSDDGGSVVVLQSLIEQACNYYLRHGHFPATYEAMQPIPVLKSGQLPYAGDDGPEKGQTYRLSVDIEGRKLDLAFRCPDEAGAWSRTWARHTVQVSVPEPVAARLAQGEILAPTLRAVEEADGTRYAVLDFSINVPVVAQPSWNQLERVLGFDWGVRTLLTAVAVDLDGHQIGRPFFLDTGAFDGRQARTRRQIDMLQAKVATLEERQKDLPLDDSQRKQSKKRLAVYRQEIQRCYRKYRARNRDLAHLAANTLLLLAVASGCSLISGESLKSLKSTGRGRDARGRWRNWRNNSQIRGVLWRVLKYKCFLAGIRLEWQRPRHTSHTCPRCGKPANTYRSPTDRSQVEGWGAWLSCEQYGWNGARDYAAALNIARLGAAFITHYQATGQFYHASISQADINPVSYMGAGAVLRLPPPVTDGRLLCAGKIYLNGWRKSVTLRSSHTADTMLRLCG